MSSMDVRMCEGCRAEAHRTVMGFPLVLLLRPPNRMSQPRGGPAAPGGLVGGTKGRAVR